MLKKHFEEVENKPAVLIDGTPVKNVFIRWLIDKNDGARNFTMRRIEIKPGGKVPLHSHREDHEIFILQGKGKFFDDKGQEELANVGDVFYVPPLEEHAMENLGKNDFAFICVIPYLEKEK
ncbi:MAG: cupin domain-containing protein [Promethearchaeota archaeon]